MRKEERGIVGFFMFVGLVMFLIGLFGY